MKNCLRVAAFLVSLLAFVDQSFAAHACLPATSEYYNLPALASVALLLDNTDAEGEKSATIRVTNIKSCSGVSVDFSWMMGFGSNFVQVALPELKYAKKISLIDPLGKVTSGGCHSGANTVSGYLCLVAINLDSYGYGSEFKTMKEGAWIIKVDFERTTTSGIQSYSKISVIQANHFNAPL